MRYKSGLYNLLDQLSLEQLCSGWTFNTIHAHSCGFDIPLFPILFTLTQQLLVFLKLVNGHEWFYYVPIGDGMRGYHLVQEVLTPDTLLLTRLSHSHSQPYYVQWFVSSPTLISFVRVYLYLTSKAFTLQQRGKNHCQIRMFALT